MFSHPLSLVRVLLALACLQSFTMAYNGSGPEECCFNYNKRRIAPSSLIAYDMTRSDCTKPGVIFANKDGKRICVDPSDKWVKVAIKAINKKRKTSAQTSKPKVLQSSLGGSEISSAV